MNALVPAPLTGEVLPPCAVLPVVAIMHPVKTTHELVFVPVGSSVAEIVERCADQCGVSRLAGGARVTINGHPIPREIWARVRVKEGAHVMVRAVPGGGSGNILKSILSLALVAVASFFFGPAGTLLAGPLGALVGAGIVIGGSLLLNALFPPASSKADTSDPVYSIASRQNSAHRWGPIPELFGRLRIAPKFATSPYTEPVGEDQYLHQLFVMGHGAMSITGIQIAGTPIEDYEDVQVEVREGYATDAPVTLVPSQVIQQDFQIEPEQGDPIIRDAADDAVAIAIDLVAPQGIANIHMKSGDLENWTVQQQIEVVNRDTGAVVYNQVYSLSGRTRDQLRRTIKIPVAKGRYFVRWTRLSGDNTGDDHIEQVLWTAIRSYRDEPVIQYSKPVALIAVRIRASKQLNGAIGDLTAVCTRKASSWDGVQWVADQETRSPADAFIRTIQGPGIARPRANHQIDWPSMEAWADLCRAKGWTFDIYRDFRSSVPDTLRDICAAGRAVPIFRDGKWSVAMEDATAPLVQMFTPRNIEGFTRTVTYAEQPHALRCKFVNEDKDWIEDEIIVYNDGYSRGNATLFETAEFPGVTSPANVFKHARYRLAERILRRSLYSGNVDAEHLVLTRGDRFKASHYVVQRKAVQGTVVAVDGQTLTLDEPVTMEAGKTYAVETRRVSEFATVIATNPVQTVAGETDQITVTGTVPKVGDLFAFGEPDTISGVYRLLRLTPGADLTAAIEFVDDAPGIQDADDGTIDPGTGVVDVVVPIATYRPRNLRVTEGPQTRATGTVYVVRLSWDMIYPSGINLLSLLVVALGADGTEKRVTVGPDVRFVDFEDILSGEWTFRVFANFEGKGIASGSDPLTVAINVPWDELGVGLGNIAIDIRYVIEFGNESLDRFNGLLDELAANTASASITLKQETDKSRAAIVEERKVRASETGALASTLDGVVATIEDPDTGLSAQATALQSLTANVEQIGDDLEATAELLNGVEAKADAATAQGLTRMEVRAGPSGTTARFAQVLRVSDGSVYSDAGFYMDVRTDGIATVVFDVQRFVLEDSTGKFTPFVFEGGVAKFGMARFKQFISDTGKLVIDGSSGTISIFD